jgi:predicted small metal-binding protein
MIYNFNCILKGISFKYKVEADNITEAKVKVREHIKNAVQIDEVVQETVNKASMDFIDFFNDTISKKT